MATSNEQKLAQTIIELIDARNGKMKITRQGIEFSEPGGLKATVSLAQTSKVISSRVIQGG